MKQVAKIFIIAIMVVCAILFAANLFAKEPIRKHKMELAVGSGALVSGQMKTTWIRPYNNWSIEPSRWHSVSLGYRYKNFIVGGYGRSYLMNAISGEGSKATATKTSWMNLAAGVSIDYKVNVGGGNVYAGITAGKMGAYDRTVQNTYRAVVGRGNEYGAHIGFNVPVVRHKMFLFAQGDILYTVNKGKYYISLAEYKTLAFPASAGLRFRL
jgi:hypothetical protein